MQDELTALHHQHTLDLVPHDNSMNVVGDGSSKQKSNSMAPSNTLKKG